MDIIKELRKSLRKDIKKFDTYLEKNPDYPLTDGGVLNDGFHEYFYAKGVMSKIKALKQKEYRLKKKDKSNGNI